ncbi:MAG: type IV pilus biogenesis/stability protein PilW [Bdellovibrionales bacterium]
MQKYSYIESSIVLAPPENIEHFTLGYQLPLADSLWLRVIQNSDYCESNSGERAYNAGIKLEEVLSYKMKPSRCNKGLIYQTLDKITDLDERFRIAYKAGAVFLSIGVDDREGARLLYEKAIAQFPNDWNLLYNASYHYLFEVQDPKKAAELMLASSKLPGSPSFLVSLAARLFTIQGQGELGYTVLQDYLEMNPSGDGADRARMRLKEIAQKLGKPMLPEENE